MHNRQIIAPATASCTASACGLPRIAFTVVVAALVTASSLSGNLLQAAPPQEDHSAVLVPGDPALTQMMVDHRLAIWESFFELKFTPEQRERLKQTSIAAWKRGDKTEIDGMIADQKLYGNEDDLKVARLTNQSVEVAALRKDPADPTGALLVQIYDAAHPERKDALRAKGLSDLEGSWKRQDALTADRDRLTGRTIGVSFTDTLILDVFADGHFKHFWAHSHCSGGSNCCRQYATDTYGEIAKDGASLAMKENYGTVLYRDPCAPNTNFFKGLDAHTESFTWSLKRDPNNRMALTLCLSSPPFQASMTNTPKTVCYVKQP